jgi:hypothetical protein
LPFSAGKKITAVFPLKHVQCRDLPFPCPAPLSAIPGRSFLFPDFTRIAGTRIGRVLAKPPCISAMGEMAGDNTLTHPGLF